MNVNDVNCLMMSQQLLQALRSFSKLEKAVSAGKGCQVRSLSTLVTISSSLADMLRIVLLHAGAWSIILGQQRWQGVFPSQ